VAERARVDGYRWAQACVTAAGRTFDHRPAPER
jgi:hypothetical protein